MVPDSLCNCELGFLDVDCSLPSRIEFNDDGGGDSLGAISGVRRFGSVRIAAAAGVWTSLTILRCNRSRAGFS
jgi:hypothetical protein